VQAPRPFVQSIIRESAVESSNLERSAPMPAPRSSRTPHCVGCRTSSPHSSPRQRRFQTHFCRSSPAASRAARRQYRRVVSRVTVPAETRIQMGPPAARSASRVDWAQVQLLERDPTAKFGKGPLGQ
jgi:hypothetical protein